MADAKIHPGQLWRWEETGENWLVTKVYEEGFASYAMLRKVESPEDVRRVRVANSPRGAVLPGFTFAHASEDS
jgi:hypothetical protein